MTVPDPFAWMVPETNGEGWVGGTRIETEDLVGDLCRSLRRLLGADDPLVARTLHDLAVLCAADGRRDLSASLWSEARRNLPDPPPETW